MPLFCEIPATAVRKHLFYFFKCPKNKMPFENEQITSSVLPQWRTTPCDGFSIQVVFRERLHVLAKWCALGKYGAQLCLGNISQMPQKLFWPAIYTVAAWPNQFDRSAAIICHTAMNTFKSRTYKYNRLGTAIHCTRFQRKLMPFPQKHTSK